MILEAIVFLITQTQVCDPHYPKTISWEEICIPPSPPDLNCKDIKVAVVVVDIGDGYPDPHNLDSDQDGIGCESYRNPK